MTASVSVRYKRNESFRKQVLNSAGVMALVNTHAGSTLRRAMGMYDASNYVLRSARAGKNRCHAYVSTGDIHAMRSNALHMTLEKSIGG